MLKPAPGAFHQNSIITSGGAGTTISVTLPVTVLAFGSGIAPSSGVSLLTITAVGDTTLTIPLVFNDYNGWNSMVLVQNTDPNSDATVRTTFRGTDLPSSETSLTVRRDCGQ